MDYRDKPPNSRQLEVLCWIAGKCPEGVMQGHAHKSSAVALQSRQLVTISRRGGVWAARMTEAGRIYLKTGHYPPRRSLATAKVPGTSKKEAAKRAQTGGPAARPPAEQLVAQVVEGGGSLKMPGCGAGTPSISKTGLTL
jgi:hypothetical protein